jgi:type II secretory pathway pseudopilin PulG
MNKKTNKQSGITLVEIMLYIAIISIVLATTSAFFATLITSRIKNQTINEVEFQGLQAIQVINKNLRNAESILSPQIGQETSSLKIIRKGTEIEFTLDNGIIYMQEGIAQPEYLTNDIISVSNLTFKNLSRANTPGAIRTDFFVEHINNSGRNEYFFEKNVFGSATLRQNN